MVIHLAISQFAKELLAAYEPDEGALTASYLTYLKKVAKPLLPTGKVLSRKSLV